MMKPKTFCFLTLAFLLLSVAVSAQVQPTGKLLSYAGKMPGQPDGPVVLKFRVFPAASGGVLCFEETQTVQVAAETFSAFVGDGTPGGIPASPCFTDNASLSIAFALDATPDVEIGSRIPITSSGFAHSIPDGAVTPPKIADGAVITPKIADGAVTTPKIADSAVTTPKLAAGSVDSSKIVAGSVGAVHVNSAQVQLRVSGDCVPGNAIRVVNPDGTVVCQPTGGGGGIGGGGTANQIAKFTAPTTIGNSGIWEVNAKVGVGVPAPIAELDVFGHVNLTNSNAVSGNILKAGALFIHNFGVGNTFIGNNAGNLTMTGSGNAGTGYQALLSNTTGNNNTASGSLALTFNTTGFSNTATGSGALNQNTTGSNNTAVGNNALVINTTGFNNTASGDNALSSNTMGTNNTAIGVRALFSNTTGGNNIAVGSNALAANTTGINNTSIGVTALANNTNGFRNVAAGGNALFKNTVGSDNTATGLQALFNNDTGNNNTATGSGALQNNTTGNNNTANGFNALVSNTGSNNTALGNSALLNNLGGSNNTAVGAGADVMGTLTNATVIGAGGSTRFSNTIQLGNDQVITVNTSGVVRAAKGFGGLCVPNAPDPGAPINCNQDVAETFATQEATEPGDVVVLVSQSASMPTVRKSMMPYEGLLLGAVSTSPGLVFDRGETLLAGDNSQRITPEKTVIGLVGRVPVKISLENGSIAVGDPITSSSTKGVAMRATLAGQIIGYALEKADQKGKVLVHLQPGYYIPPQQLAFLNEINELKVQLSELQSLFQTVLAQRVEGSPSEAAKREGYDKARLVKAGEEDQEPQ